MNLDVWAPESIIWCGLEVLQNPAFHVCWDSVDFGVILLWFSMALGPILMIFGGLETGLKIMIFDGFPGRPGAEGALPGGGNLVHPWAPLHQPNSME